MTNTVFIPCAGLGTRLGSKTRFLNKALVRVGTTSSITRIISSYPSSTRFVIALGYQSSVLQQYLELAHPTLDITYRLVDPFDGPESSLGFTITSCRDLLQAPFIFNPCDSIISTPLSSADFQYNWIGYTSASVSDLDQYRHIIFDDDGYFQAFLPKTQHQDISRPYSGLACIYDHESFWSAYDSSLSQNELLLGELPGINSVASNGNLACRDLPWFDVGNPQALSQASLHFSSGLDPHILDKEEEAIWFLEDQVIKFSTDSLAIRNRVERHKKLSSVTPTFVGSTQNMHAYSFADGIPFSRINNPDIFRKLLEFSRTSIWSSAWTSSSLINMTTINQTFYHDKTLQRLSDFFSRYNYSDSSITVNGNTLPPIYKQLESVNWDRLCNGIAVNFHGDYHFENILYDKSTSKFTLIDWRSDYGGRTDHGDLYYDLAKLMHGLIINHGIIDKEHYDVHWDGSNVASFSFHRLNYLVDYEQILVDWLTHHSLDIEKTYTLTALIFINIATLHHDPYSKLLFLLGRDLLYKHPLQ